MCYFYSSSREVIVANLHIASNIHDINLPMENIFSSFFRNLRLTQGGLLALPTTYFLPNTWVRDEFTQLLF